MRRRLWNRFSFFFIKTPIAAIFIIIILTVGLFTWMNNTTIRSYLTVTGIPLEQADSTLVRVQGDFGIAGLGLHAPITWYLSAGGDRYEGTVIRADNKLSDSIIEVEISRKQWLQAKAQSGSRLYEPSVYIDLPQGRQTVWAKMINKEVSQ